MPTTVTIPNVGDVDFPDSMSIEQISQASHKLYLQSGANAPRVQAPNAPGLTDQKAAFEGGGPIAPKDNEDFSTTMQRAAKAGKTVTEGQVTGQAIQGLRDAPKALAGAAVAGTVGPALLAAPGEAIAGVGGISAEALPFLKAAAPHLETIVKVAKVLGYGSLGLKEILDIGKALSK